MKVIAITAFILILVLVIIIQGIGVRMTVKAWIYYAEQNGRKELTAEETAEEFEKCIRFVKENRKKLKS